jgi:hypothetical protein
VASCTSYQHDLSFWQGTMITEFDLVCEVRNVVGYTKCRAPVKSSVIQYMAGTTVLRNIPIPSGAAPII